MRLIKYSFSLDMHKIESQVLLSVKKKDTGRYLLVSFTENGKPYEITPDCYAVFRAKKPDETVLFNDCSIVDNKVYYQITAQTVAEVGMFGCEITLYGADNVQITSPSFTVIVDDTVQDDNEIESANEFTALTQAMSKYAELTDGVVTSARIADVEILASKWVGSESPYSQVVSIDGITENSQVDLTPDAQQLAIFHNKDLAFVTENVGGIITVYAIGQKPKNDYIIQATITEVIV